MTMPHSQKAVDGGRIGGPQAVPSGIEIVIAFTLINNAIGHVTFNGRNLGSFVATVPMASTLFNEISAAFTTRVGSLTPTGCNMLAVQLRDMSDVTNPVLVSTSTAVAGTSASPGMPPEVALVLTENVVQRGRGAKGRIYWPCWATNADAGQGQATSAAQNNLQLLGSDIYTIISNHGLHPAVAKVHRQQYQGVTGTIHPDRPAAAIDVTSYTVRNPVWDTQRRRTQQ